MDNQLEMFPEMPPPVRQPMVIGVRLHPEDLDKLDALCRVTDQTRSGLLRYLLRHAQAQSGPQFRLDIGKGGPVGAR